VTHGADQTFTITPNEGYHIANVLVDGMSVGAVTSYAFTHVVEGHSIQALFAVNTYKIEASAGENGSISPNGPIEVNYGSNQTYTITPGEGYQVSDVLIDEVSIGAVTSHTFSAVDKNHTIVASFVVDEIIIAMSENIYDNGKYGYGFGSNGPYTVLSATFQSDGNDRLLHVQSYDIDSIDEIGIYLNGNFLGYLSGADEDLGPGSLWWLPVDLQLTGENKLEFWQKTAGETWGVQRLGLFSPGIVLGDLESPQGDDRSHVEGFELHFQGSHNRLLEMAGWTFDTDGIELVLNSQLLGVIPQGPEGDWSPAYHLLLSSEYLKTGDNILEIRNNLPAASDWGVNLLATWPYDIPVGTTPEAPGGSTEEVSYLIPVGTEDKEFNTQFYDVELADQMLIVINGIESGYGPITPENQWGGIHSIILAPNQLALVEIRSLYTGLIWGVRLGGL
jgi:hypothetical protein